MNILANKKVLFIIGGSLLAITIFIINLFSSSGSSSILPNPTPTKHPDDFYSEEYTRRAAEVAKEELPQLQRDDAVSKFMDTLPYSGTYIQVTYTLSTNVIAVTMPQENLDAANKEFDELLRRNNIQDKNWIVDLVINGQKVPRDTSNL